MIKYNNISVSYNDKIIIKDFSLNIKEGDKILISGKSGCGKSTLFKLLLGFSSYSSGQIFYKDLEVNSKNVWNIRNEIAYVTQDLNIGRNTVLNRIYEYFSFKNLRHHMPKLDVIKSKFRQFRLDDDALNKDFMQLSGGEKQRVAIIISILLNRKIFLLDEITSSLDKELKKYVVDFFCGDPEYTVISISHDHEWFNRENIKIFDMEKKLWEQ